MKNLNPLGALLLLMASWTSSAAADCSQRYFIYGKEALVLADRSHLGAGFVGSPGYVEVGGNSRIHASALAGQLQLRSNALLNGSAYTDQSVGTQPQALISGSVQPSSAAPQCLEPELPAAAPGSADVLVVGTLELPPGSYGNVSVAVGARLLVSGGTYQFESLIFEADTMLIGTWTGEPARLVVQDAASFGDRHRQLLIAPSTTPSQAIVEVLSHAETSLRIGTNSEFAAKVVAPESDISVGSRTTIAAPLYGRTLLLEPDVVVGRYKDTAVNQCNGGA